MEFQDWLKDSSKTILFDGAMGTQLMKRGLEPGVLPDLFNIENPEIVKDILNSYYDSGSDMVQTCTFSSNLINLKKHGLDSKIIEINEAALSTIASARTSDKLIVGDIGPSGEFRPPVGNASGDKWLHSFQMQVEVLEPGVDLWHIETMSDLQEMQAAISAVRKISQKPIIASMTYKKTKKRGFFTIMGDSLESCINALEEVQITVIGANCTLGSNQMIDLIREMSNLTNFPLSVKPNAGQPRLEGGMTVYNQTPEEFASDIGEMIDLGVKIVGGCCGTTPTHIKQLKLLIDAL
jgi:5-methyltetrahydrofolate--homocysteine methyltransferase